MIAGVCLNEHPSRLAALAPQDEGAQRQSLKKLAARDPGYGLRPFRDDVFDFVDDAIH
jgi:hypothetical protein